MKEQHSYNHIVIDQCEVESQSVPPRKTVYPSQTNNMKDLEYGVHRQGNGITKTRCAQKPHLFTQASQRETTKRLRKKIYIVMEYECYKTKIPYNIPTIMEGRNQQVGVYTLP